MHSTGSASSRKARLSRQACSKPTFSISAASWASRVSRMISRWQATSRGSSGPVGCSRNSSGRYVVPQAGRRLELVVPPLHEQPPAGLAQRVGERGERRVVEGASVGAKMPASSAPAATASALAWATRARATSGSEGRPKWSSTKIRSSGASAPKAATTPSGVGSSAYRTAQTQAGRRRPEPKVSFRCASPRIRRWVGESTGSGLAASRAIASSTEAGWKNCRAGMGSSDLGTGLVPEAGGWRGHRGLLPVPGCVGGAHARGRASAATTAFRPSRRCRSPDAARRGAAW